jgi:caa(3)-type oxidase subunit IV
MDQTTVLFIEFWVLIGAILGGVVTPLIAERKGMNDWLAALLGVAVGAVGNVLLLFPLWGFLLHQPSVDNDLLPWQRDAITADEAQQRAAAVAATQSPVKVLYQGFMENFWPASRADAEHSHRGAYIGVFVALVVITFIEVFLTVIDPSAFSIVGPLAALSAAKVVLVVMYFMHLRYDNTWYSGIFVASLPFAAMVLIVLASVA